MATKKESVGNTEIRFTAPNERASAIAEIAADYPDMEIAATVTPITSVEQAMGLTDAAIRVKDPSVVFENGRQAVIDRYEQLGKSGTSSVVELEVPGGGRKFDFGTFYAGVDEALTA